MKLITLFIAVLNAVVFSSPYTMAQPIPEAPWLDGRWPQERGTLPPHPDAVFGRLDNGFRYVILPNAKPEGRVHLSLDVQVGSLMEDGDELGLAHYLEHMAFNGSRHFPPGTLIPFLQKHGMSFGGDVNAHTSFAETVYTLDLSSASKDGLDQGLLVLRDVAGGLLLLPQEVDKERGVILAEKAARDTEKSRAGQRRRDILFDGTKFTQEPIGVEDVLLAADSGMLRRFYDAWYRPERMVLVAVGAVDPASLRDMIQAAFAELAPRGAAKPVADWGTPKLHGIRAAHEPTANSGLSVTVTAMHPRAHEADSVAVQRRQLLDAVVTEMVQGRLLARGAAADAPFVNARYGFSTAFELFPTATLAAACDPHRWPACVSALEQAIRRAREHGFSDAEFEQARHFYRTRIETMVAQAANQRSTDIAAEIVRSVNGDRVFQSETQTRDLLLPLLDALTRAEAEQAFRAAWNVGNRLIFTSGDADLSAEAVTKAWEDSAKVSVAPRAQAEAHAFPYLEEPGQSAAVTGDSSRTLPASDLTEREIRLANGLVLRLLPTPFEKGRLSLSLLFGNGAATLSDRDHDIALASVATLAETGTGRLSREDVRRLFAGRKLAVGERLGEDALVISASGASDDLDLALTALWTQFQDPTVTEEARQRLLTKLRLDRNDRLNTVEGAAPEAVERFLYGGAKRSNQLDEDRVETVSLAQMKTFLTQSRTAGARTLIAVGDFDAEALIARAARLFALAPTAALVAPPERKPLFPAGGSLQREVADPLDKASLVLAWRGDLPDAADQRTLASRRLLAVAVNDRLRQDLREDLGATYSPSARYRHDAAFGGFGMVVMAVKTEPALLDEVRAAARAAAASLANEGIAAGTAARLRAPMLAAWKNARRRNEMWSGLLELETLRGLPYAQWNADLPGLLNGLTDDDLAREAKAIFSQPAAEITVISAPRGESL